VIVAGGAVIPQRLIVAVSRNYVTPRHPTTVMSDVTVRKEDGLSAVLNPAVICMTDRPSDSVILSICHLSVANVKTMCVIVLEKRSTSLTIAFHQQV